MKTVLENLTAINFNFFSSSFEYDSHRKLSECKIELEILTAMKK